MLKKVTMMALVCLLAGLTNLAFAQRAGSGGSQTEDAAQGKAGAAKTLAQMVSSNPKFSKLKAALEAADLTAVLESPGPFTVFAPTDSAFNSMQGETTDDLLKIENKDKLLSILRSHIVPGNVTADQLQKTNHLKTVETAELAVQRANGRVTVNGAAIRQPGMRASNGVIYVVDKVLMPTEGQNMGNSRSTPSNKPNND